MKLLQAIDEFRQWREHQVKTNTVHGYDCLLRQFCLYAHNPELEEIRVQDITNYFHEMREMGWEENGFLCRAMAMRKMFQYFAMQGCHVLNPELIPIPQSKFVMPRVASEEQFLKLISYIPANKKEFRYMRNLAIIRMLWDTGVRIGELCSLNVRDCDMEKRCAVIRTEKAKTKRPYRQIFWTEPTNEVLVRWINRRQEIGQLKDDALFVCVTTGRVGHRLTIKGAGEALRRYCNHAGLDYINPHSFRHSVGHRIIKNNGSLSDVANFLGHSSIQSSLRYNTWTDDEMKEKYDRLLDKGKQ